MITINPKGAKAWITFSYMPSTEVGSAAIAGEWNNWEAEPMRSKKDGSFYIRKYLPVGNSYEFRYLLDNKEWVNDETTAKVWNPFGTENSVLELAEEAIA